MIAAMKFFHCSKQLAAAGRSADQNLTMRELEDANVRGRECEEGWSFLKSRTIDPDRKEAWSRPPTIERLAILWAHLIL
jgi:hypothetical protein